MSRQAFGAALSEDRLPDGDFHAVIREARRSATKFPVVIVSHRRDWEAYLSAVRAGAFDCVTYPVNPGELELSVWIALREAQRSSQPAA